MFSRPELLWSALLLPLLILLHLRGRQVSEYRVSWLECWEEVIEEEQGLNISRLNRLLLLLAQLLTGLLLVLAAAGPLNSCLPAGETLTLALDCSISMGAQQGGATHLDAARAEAERIIKSLPGDTRVNLVLLRDGVEETTQEALPRQALQALERLECGIEPLNAALACQHLQSYPAPVILITDKDLHWGERTIRVGKQLDNTGITAACYDYYSGRVIFTVKNYSPGTRQVLVKLLSKDQIVDAAHITIPAGESGGASLKAPQAEGTLAVKIEERDMLDADNVFLVAAGDSGRKKVLLQVEDVFLKKALRSAAEVKLQTKGGGPGERDAYDVVITDNPDAAASWPPDTGIWLYLPGDGGDEPQALKFMPASLTDGLREEGAYVRRAGRAEEKNGFQTLLQAGGRPVMTCGVEKGRKTVYSTICFKDTDLVLRPAFPILVSNIINWLGDEAAGQFDANPPAGLVLGDCQWESDRTGAVQAGLFAEYQNMLLAAALLMLLLEWEVYRRGI